MSRQFAKIAVAAVGLLAVLSAASQVSAQGASANLCARGAQGAITSWSQGMRQTILTFARNTQSTAAEATNFEALTGQVNELGEQLLGYFNADTPLDVSTVNSLAQRLVKFQFDLTQQLLQRNSGSMLGFSSSYFKALTAAMETNATLMQSLTASCVPGSRRPSRQVHQ